MFSSLPAVLPFVSPSSQISIQESKPRHDQSALTSIASRMWQARRMALPDFFLYWHHINRYISLYREIQKSSRQNKRQRLERFLKDSIDLALIYSAFD